MWDTRLEKRGSIYQFSAYGKTEDDHTKLVKPVTERQISCAFVFLRFHTDTMKLEIRLFRILVGGEGRMWGAMYSVYFHETLLMEYGAMEVGWGATDPADFFVSHASIITVRRILPSWSLVPEGE